MAIDDENTAWANAGVLAIDDTPTKCYGKYVEGAGIHHDPTPVPTDKDFCYGHVWVTLAMLVKHPHCGSNFSK